MKPYKKALHIFRRDLRLVDNTALHAACTAAETVIPCFIFDPRQVGKNEYKSEHAIQFMCESLDDLTDQLKQQKGRIYFFAGKAEDVVRKIIRAASIDAVFFNADYTPFSLKRDQAIQKVCAKQEVVCEILHDALLNPPEAVLKKKWGAVCDLYAVLEKGSTK